MDSWPSTPEESLAAAAEMAVDQTARKRARQRDPLDLLIIGVGVLIAVSMLSGVVTELVAMLLVNLRQLFDVVVPYLFVGVALVVAFIALRGALTRR
jgi:hypothetical protein